MNQALRDLLASPWVKKLPAPSLVASAVAAVIHPSLAAIGFALPPAVGALAQLGFNVGTSLLPTIVEVAKKGLQALADWFEQEMAKTPEVNEAAARVMIDQAPKVAEVLEETHPEDKSEIADSVAQGMQAYGGATSEIAQQYNAALKNIAELKTLVEQMKNKVDTWASQAVEARRGSMIENVEMRMTGRGGKQEVRAEDDSSISGVKQIIE